LSFTEVVLGFWSAFVATCHVVTETELSKLSRYLLNLLYNNESDSVCL